MLHIIAISSDVLMYTCSHLISKAGFHFQGFDDHFLSFLKKVI